MSREKELAQPAEAFMAWCVTFIEEENMSFFGASQPVVLNPGEGTHLDVLGEAMTLLVSGQQTNGAFTVLSGTSPPGGGTPLHKHHNEDEALYVLEGEYAIQCGARTVRAGPGSFVFAPREVPHKLTNVSTGPSTHLGIISPAGFERFFEEISQLLRPPAVEPSRRVRQRDRQSERTAPGPPRHAPRVTWW